MKNIYTQKQYTLQKLCWTEQVFSIPAHRSIRFTEQNMNILHTQISPGSGEHRLQFFSYFLDFYLKDAHPSVGVICSNKSIN